MTIVLVIIHNIFNSVAYPLADPLGKGLRAAGDVKYITVISIATTVARLLFSAIFAMTFRLGVIGIVVAMCLDWVIRAIIFWVRFKKGRWKTLNIINEPITK